jgi:hypothetical protein
VIAAPHGQRQVVSLGGIEPVTPSLAFFQIESKANR